MLLRSLFILLTTTAIFAVNSYAQEPSASTLKEAETLTQIAERNHARINAKLQASSAWLDEYFGDERLFDEQASTEVRLSMVTDLAESDGGKIKLKLRGKLNLPRVEDRLSLIFEGEPDEKDVTGLEEEAGTAELRYNLSDHLVKEASISLGLRGGLTHPTLYTRLRSQANRQRGRFLLRGTPTITHDSSEGFTLLMRMDAEFKPRARQFYRSSTTPIWSEESDQVKLKQVFSNFYQLSSHRYLSIDWHLNFQSKPHREVESSILKLRHRRELWKDRLYAEVSPGLRFREENDHRIEWLAGATLEWVFHPDH